MHMEFEIKGGSSPFPEGGGGGILLNGAKNNF